MCLNSQIKCFVSPEKYAYIFWFSDGITYGNPPTRICTYIQRDTVSFCSVVREYLVWPLIRAVLYRCPKKLLERTSTVRKVPQYRPHLNPAYFHKCVIGSTLAPHFCATCLTTKALDANRARCVSVRATARIWCNRWLHLSHDSCNCSGGSGWEMENHSTSGAAETSRLTPPPCWNKRQKRSAAVRSGDIRILGNVTLSIWKVGHSTQCRCKLSDVITSRLPLKLCSDGGHEFRSPISIFL